MVSFRLRLFGVPTVDILFDFAVAFSPRHLDSNRRFVDA